MSRRDLLFEIGCEEVPARLIDDAVKQLGDKLSAWLSENRIAHGAVKTYATPRRLAVIINDVEEKQADMEEEVKGPAARIAKTSDGNWSKAAEGFARKNGLTVDQLTLKEVKGETYVFAQVHQPGEATVAQLLKGLPEVINSLHFPKTMRWHDRTRFIRPVRWLVCLFGEEVVPVEWAGLKASNVTRGHRFLGREIALTAPAQYVSALREQFVLVDVEKRQELILSQLRQLEEQQNWVIPVDQGLLQEVTNLVEFPTAFYGTFAEEYLAVPREVLITTMREHQRYFPVEDRSGQLLPFFVAVRNGNERGLATVARGNEKVLRARLADARFFYDEDLKLPIAEANAKLSHIVYQEELGSVGARIDRIGAIAQTLAERNGLSQAEQAKLARAAAICKFDLATQMIGEFPELEGIMGRHYALAQGEDAEVAEAIYEHYLPRFAGDEVPQHQLGGLIGLADKMDAIASSFGIGIQPTGSQDPYGLRRRAAGIVQILLNKAFQSLSLSELISAAVDQLAQAGLLKVERQEVERDLEQFFALRLKAVMQEMGIRYDVIEAVLQADIAYPAFVIRKAQVLMDQLDREAFKLEVEGFTRVANLAAKADGTALSVDLLTEPAEQALYQALTQAKTEWKRAEENNDPAALYHALMTMVPQIHHFFDHVMVMVEDDTIRKNRLALLKDITTMTSAFAAFEQVVFPS
ncbi:glycine--tRNA ligase subunit beta [Laceyella putida]|uniref:Glycine--tRNA ligase beta subunit n=1 Tax=Laceyella putida TaxID=110101 RepID=A0ABW2RHX7_9BACL